MKLEEELERTGFRYQSNGDGTFDVCYDHAQDSSFGGVNGYKTATVREDGMAWYIDCHMGLGEGWYDKEDWSLVDAIKDQCLEENDECHTTGQSPRVIEAKDFLHAVATFNADPYCVEDDDMCEELFKETHGELEEITDEEEFKIAALQLDLADKNPQHIYKCGSAKVCLNEDF